MAVGVVALAAIVVGALVMLDILDFSGKKDPLPIAPPTSSIASQTPSVSAPTTTKDTNPPETYTPSPTTSYSPTPTPSPSPEISDTPPEPSEVTTHGMPGDGGEIRVDDSASFEFTPNIEGLWLIYTSNNGDDDPFIEITEKQGMFIAEDDDSGVELNAYIAVYLEPGVTYVIRVDFYYSDIGGTCTLTAIHSSDLLRNNASIPGSGGTAWVSDDAGDDVEFLFMPERSGMWQFWTAGAYDCDPYLELYEYPDYYITGDDDSGGELNALIYVYLESGRIYRILASDSYGDPSDFYFSALYDIADPGSDEPMPVQLYGISDYHEILSVAQANELTAVLREFYDTTGVITRIVVDNFEEMYEGQFLEAMYQSCDFYNAPPFGLCIGLNVNSANPQLQFIRYSDYDFSGILGDEWLDALLLEEFESANRGPATADKWFKMLLNVASRL